MNTFYILLILACYRIAILITYDEIFKPIRNWIGTHPKPIIREWLGYLVHCPYCVGFWVALGLSLYYYPDNWVLMTFAIAGGQVFLQRLVNDQ